MTKVTKQFICIRCPIGCIVDTEYDDVTKEVFKVSGNNCNRGKEYVTNELTDPRRLLTTTVKITGGVCNVIPVATSVEIPKGKMFEVMKELSKVEVKSPIKRGDVVVANILDTKADIVAQCDM